MSARTILILAPLQLEARSIGKAIGVHPIPVGSELAVKTSGSVEIHTVGIRACRLPPGLLAGPRFTPQAIRCVVLAGLAGGLDPSLRIGDVVVDCDEATRPAACGDFAARFGRVHTAKEIVSTAAGKAALHQATGAIAVDMEADVIRNAIAGSAVPFIGIRAISDTADISLPAAIGNWIDPIGYPKAMAVAKDLLRHPGLIRDARRLQRDTATALDALGIAIRKVISRLTTQ